MDRLEQSIRTWPVTALPATLAGRTRRAYDLVAAVYPVSSLLFHSHAHRCVLDASGFRDGMRVLEVATGSGEMFDRLVRKNGRGTTIGVDLSPNMAARTQRIARRKYPRARTHCQAVDARHMPFRDQSFDAIFCCYLLELLSAEDIQAALREFHRILREEGRLALVLIGQNAAAFNAMYKVAGRVAPEFWGRQVEQRVPELMERIPFRIMHDRMVKQMFYPSRVIVARK